ncbi:hypothetical protein QR98_0053950 [Sarcoptes scabiei]|uniref:Uncharacterized protein n=1 Tax=Sarcoptes scabiei TaxID=52283 RepID=A0A132A7J9_SARSC|nr:hypothetical protein QR98_0053950 [Sarcoptes scabiei]
MIKSQKKLSSTFAIAIEEINDDGDGDEYDDGREDGEQHREQQHLISKLRLEQFFSSNIDEISNDEEEGDLNDLELIEQDDSELSDNEVKEKEKEEESGDDKVVGDDNSKIDSEQLVVFRTVNVELNDEDGGGCGGVGVVLGLDAFVAIVIELNDDDIGGRDGGDIFADGDECGTIETIGGVDGVY